MFCSDDCRSYPSEEKFWSDDWRSWPPEQKINNHGCWGKHVHIPDNDYWGIRLFHVVWTIYFFIFGVLAHLAIFQLYHANSCSGGRSRSSRREPPTMEYILFSSTEHCAWATISPNELQYCVTYISLALLCWNTELSAIKYFGDLLLKSAFERIFNLMQMILVKIKWHFKWTYLIQKFHDMCLSYYFSYINFMITCKVSTCVPNLFIHLTTLIYYISLHLLYHSTLHYWLI